MLAPKESRRALSGLLFGGGPDDPPRENSRAGGARGCIICLFPRHPR